VSEPLSIIEELRRLCVALRVVGANLHYRPRSVVTPELGDRMALHKSELLALVERFEERAAIMEFDGDLGRAEAERRAWASILRTEVSS